MVSFIIRKALTAVRRSELGSIHPHNPESTNNLDPAEICGDAVCLGVNPMTENAKVLLV